MHCTAFIALFQICYARGMHILDVIPITKTAPGEYMTYFAPKAIPPGALVFAPLRSKKTPAIVIGARTVRDTKTSLKASSFALKKIDRAAPVSFLLPAFIRAAHDTAVHFAAPLGSVLYALIPKPVLDNAPKIFETKSSAKEKKIAREENVENEKVVLQTSKKERFDVYRSLIRESFGLNESVYLAVPTVQDAEEAHSLLSRGIERYAFVLHGSLPKGKLLKQVRGARETARPVLIIGTPQFLFLPRRDIKTVIIEREHARAYKRMERPFIDTRAFAENLARHLHARLVMGDMPLRIETIARHFDKECEELRVLKTSVRSDAHNHVIDMREASKNIPKKEQPLILSDALRSCIREVHAHGEHLFIFSARRGIAPITVCEDCGHTVMSGDGASPMTLHETKKGRVFVSHQTGETRSAKERCKNCGSWKLKELGIGIQRTEQALKKQFPNVPLFVLDRDSAKTHVQAAKKVREFYETSGSVLLGTEMALGYLTRSVACAAIASIDSLLSLPEWRAEERLFSIITRLREITEDALIVQTRHPENPALAEALRGSLAEFQRRQIAERQEFGYPPSTVLIKLSRRIADAKAADVIARIKTEFPDYTYTEYESKAGKVAVHNTLVRVSKGAWPDTELSRRLAGFPPSITVNVDPESLF